MEIGKNILPADMAIQSGAIDKKSTTEEPKDTFTKSPDRSPRFRQAQQLTDSIANVMLKSDKKEPVPLNKAAYWNYETEDKHSIEAVFQTPAGSTFICCHSFDTENRDTSRSYTVAFDDKGKELWKYHSDKKYSVEGHAFLSDGSCYVMCNSEERWDHPYIAALNPDGTEKWRFQPETEERCTSIQATADGTIYAKIQNEMYAIDKDGKMKWKHRIGINSDDYFHEVTPDGTNILANDNFSNNFGYDSFYAIDPDGKGRDMDLPDIGTFPIRDNKGSIYYGGEKGEFYGIDIKTGNKWSLQLDSERGFKTPHWGSDGNIYVEGRFDNSLYALSPQGKLLWRQVIEDRRPPGMGLDQFYRVTPSGSVFYAIDGRDAIQEISSKGEKVREIQVPGGFSEFAADNKGNLYIREYGDRIVLCNVESDKRAYFPMEIAGNIDLKEVLPDGSLVFQGMCERYNVRLDPDEEVKKMIEEVAAEKPKEHEEIIVEDDWVVIGNLKLPVKQ